MMLVKQIKVFKARLLNFINLFTTPLKVSHYLELVKPLWISHKLQARVVDVWDETKNARTLTLRPGRIWRRHRAGQHIRVGVPIDGKQYIRTYSISSSPERTDFCITITVKAMEGGRMSTHLVRNLRKGAYLPISLPQGEFVLPYAMPVLPLFITAGSGITPVMSMLRDYVAVGNMPDIVHMHYAPHAYDVIFGKELQELQERFPLYHYHPIYTRVLGEGSSKSNYFSEEQLKSYCPDSAKRDVWACGPQPLLSSVEAHFTSHGRAKYLHIERFRAPVAKLEGEVRGGKVHFLKEGKTVTADGKTPLLRVMEDAGMNPSHGCRMGLCHTCDIPLKAGSVRDLRSGEILSEAGSLIQICVCAAAGDCEF